VSQKLNSGKQGDVEMDNPFPGTWKESWVVLNNHKRYFTSELVKIYESFTSVEAYNKALKYNRKVDFKTKSGDSVSDGEEGQVSGKKRKLKSNPSDHMPNGSKQSKWNPENRPGASNHPRNDHNNRSGPSNQGYRPNNTGSWNNYSERNGGRQDNRRNNKSYHRNSAPNLERQQKDFNRGVRRTKKKSAPQKDAHPVSPINETDVDEFRKHLNMQGSRNECKYRVSAISSAKIDDHPIMKQNPLTPFSPIIIEGQRLMAFLDTGSDVSLINKRLFDKNSCFHNFKLNSVNGELQFAQKGSVTNRFGQTEKLKISYNGRKYEHEFDVLELEDGMDVLIGTDILPYIGVALVGVAVNWDDNNEIFDKLYYKVKV